MAVSDAQRGLDPKLLENLRRGALLDPIGTSRPIGIETLRANAREEGALKLGKIYAQMPPDRRRLGDWALPTARNVMGERVLAYQLDEPTQIVLGADLSIETRISMYDRYFETVMPELGKKALEWGLKTLTEQSQKLRLLLIEVADSKFAKWMSDASREITRRAGSCIDDANAADRRSKFKSGIVVDPRPASPPQQKRTRELIDRYNGCLLRAAKSFVALPSIEPSLASYLQPQIPLPTQLRYQQLLQILLSHSKMADLVQAFADSPVKGAAAAKDLVQESYEAVNDFKASLAGSPRSVWRYPVLIVGGLRELGLGDLDSFRDFAIAIGVIEAGKSPETLLNYIGIGLFAVALLSGVGVGVAILDVVVSGANTTFSFIRERQQDQAVKASLFLPEGAKLATEGGYADTKLGVAFTLLSAISFLGTIKAARATTAGVHPEAPRLPKEPPNGNVITDAARGKTSIVTPKSAAMDSTPFKHVPGTEPPSVPKALEGTPSVPPKALPIDEFADLKLAANEAPAIANPTADQVADYIKAFKKQLKRLNAEGLEAANFKEFYVTPRQAQTFSRLSDAILKSGPRQVAEVLTGSRATLLSESEIAAENLRRRLADHWDAALPGRGKGKRTAQQAAADLLKRLTEEPPLKGNLNNNLRDKLFDGWRRRFLTRVAKDEALLRDLEVQAGVVFRGENAPSAFCILVRDDAGRFSYVGLDLDHAVIRHEDAVMRAVRTNDASMLTSTVDSANLQLMTARENRYVIEKLRELDRLYWSVKAGPAPRAIQPFR